MLNFCSVVLRYTADSRAKEMLTDTPCLLRYAPTSTGAVFREAGENEKPSKKSAVSLGTRELHQLTALVIARHHFRPLFAPLCLLHNGASKAARELKASMWQEFTRTSYRAGNRQTQRRIASPPQECLCKLGPPQDVALTNDGRISGTQKTSSPRGVIICDFNTN